MPWWWNFIFDNDVQKAWKPFAKYIEGEDLSAREWELFEIPVTDTNRLKAVGRGAYAWIFHPDFVNIPNRAPQMFEDSNASLFQTHKDARLIFQGLEPGSYTVEFWDTWQGGVTSRARLEVKTDRAEVRLPPVGKDIAFKIKKKRP
jgi:hypothetical protein